jgi:pilus assembly protein CpaF
MQVVIRIAENDRPVSALNFAAPSVLLVGRHSDCDLRLEGDLVSRKHARILLGSTAFIVEDLSANGTEVAPNVKIHGERRELEYGSSLRIGPFALMIGEPMREAQGRPMEAPRRRRSQPPAGQPVPQPRPSVPAVAYAVQPPPVAYGAPQQPPAVAYGPPTPAYAPAAPAPAPAPAPPAPAPLAQPAAIAVQAPRVTMLADERAEAIALRRRIHAELLKNLDLAKIEPTRADDPSLRPRVLTALKRIVRELDAEIPAHISREEFIGELAEEALGLGPLEPLLADASITEVMVVDPQTIYIERGGRLELTNAVFTDDERVRAVIERIVTPLGRRIDESQPLVDARLKDGSRVNAVIRPLALRGTAITIRKFPKKRLMVDDLIRLNTLTAPMARFLSLCVIAKKNILISGGTGSGKTTLLNILSAAIPSDERIITIEDAAELQLHQPHVIPLETKPANMEGKGAFTIRDLVKNSLRMRPDRIVVGECRGGEALDMLQAMNTGHDGSLTTIHSNSPPEALARLETLALMAGLDLPARAIREQIGRSIHIIVQQSRMGDGSRKITHISEIDELDSDGRFEVRNIFEFERSGVDENGKVLGEFGPTGYLPSFVDELIVRGLLKLGEGLI